MGKCNLKCFFCIGNELKQISEKVGKSISGISQIGEHFSKWKNFLPFLNQTKEMGIKKLYLMIHNKVLNIYNKLLYIFVLSITEFIDIGIENSINRTFAFCINIFVSLQYDIFSF